MRKSALLDGGWTTEKHKIVRNELISWAKYGAIDVTMNGLLSPQFAIIMLIL